jgi:DNA topoisomerase-1
VDWQAGRLRFAQCDAPGIRRHRSGRSFFYVGPGGRKVRSPETLARIRALAIPPAWEDVWICCDGTGHIQATGRDAKGRKQYRYHPRYRSHRDELKFSRLPEFAKSLPRLRQRIFRDMQSPGLDQNKVLAVVARLLEVTCIRIGNSEYVRQNGSFGLTTLRDKHVQPCRHGLRLCFPGKSGIEHDVEIDDPRLAHIVRRCRDLPGYELFQYVTESGERAKIDSTMVNDYIREAMQGDFTAKDFRTWHGTIEAVLALGGVQVPRTKSQLTKAIAAAVGTVAQRLRNRPATCRKFYIHPAVLTAFAEGKLPSIPQPKTRYLPHKGLSEEERLVLQLLAESLSKRVKRAA